MQQCVPASACAQALPKRPRNTSISISSYDTNASSDSGDENSGRTSSKSKGSNRGGRGRGVKAGSMDKRPYRRKSDSCAQGKGRTTAARRNSTSAVSGLAGAGTRREPRPEGILGGIYEYVVMWICVRMCDIATCLMLSQFNELAEQMLKRIALCEQILARGMLCKEGKKM
eukprot:scaffold117203_cov21-Tisochrysis_lutea.AAC.2